MLSILIFAAVVLGFFTGSLWLFTAALSALVLKTFPILLVLVALSAAAFLIFRHYYRR
jgi:hypothetical protein